MLRRTPGGKCRRLASRYMTSSQRCFSERVVRKFVGTRCLLGRAINGSGTYAT